MSCVSIYSLDLLEGVHVGALCQHVVLHISQWTRIRARSLALGDFGESCEIFWGIWIGLDFSSHMGVLLGHVINRDYKFSIGKMVLNLLPPPPSLFGSVFVEGVFQCSLWTVWGAVTTQSISHMWERAGQGAVWNPPATSPCRGALLLELGTYGSWRA